MSKKTAKKKLEMTIAPELFEAWKRMKRKNDAKLLMELTSMSRPIIDNALNFGHVKNVDVINAITKFYKDRLAAEQKEGMAMLKKISK